MGTSYVRLSDVFNHDAAVRLHTGGMGGDVIHILQGGMNHMALIGIHWLTNLAVHIHPQIVTQNTLSIDCRQSPCRSHPSADCYCVPPPPMADDVLAVHIHPQIVTAISCVQQVYPTLSIEQPGNMDMIIGSISEEIRQHSCERLFPFLFTLDSHIVAAPHDKIFFTVFVVFSFYVSRISGHSVCHCTHIPRHHPILLAYHLQLQTDFYAVEQVLLRNA